MSETIENVLSETFSEEQKQAMVEVFKGDGTGDFTKFKSIENHYRGKFINDTFEYYPEYMTCSYINTEKADGANFQFKFTTLDDGSITLSYGKRTSLLDMSDKFFGYQEVVTGDRYTEFTEMIFEFMRDFEHREVIVYGELIGSKINNRIDYGDGKKVLFFDISIDGFYVTQRQFFEFMNSKEFDDITIPITGIYDTFDEAMEADVENVHTLINPDADPENDNSYIEGVVIKPYDVIVTNKDDQQVLFYVKHKSDRFAEKMKVRKHKTPAVINPEVQNAQDVFASYLTKNRLIGIFSKMGEIETPKDMGQYIKAMSADAQEDFLKDNMELFMELTDKQRKLIFKVAGKVVSKMLQEYL
jgi:Rnl2 family RNA ligase